MSPSASIDRFILYVTTDKTNVLHVQRAFSDGLPINTFRLR